MNPLAHIRAGLNDAKQRATRWILAQRLRARHATLQSHPSVVWNYEYRDMDALTIGRNVWIGPFVEIVVQRRSPRSAVEGGLRLDDGSIIAAGANVRAAGGIIHLGEHSGIGQNCVVVASNHLLDRSTLYLRSKWDEQRTGVLIGKNVWIAANCVLLPGTVIGDNVVIAAGSVVRGEVPANELWGGVPARKIRDL
jgi:acetyltransferase-like isoleucine patch superfamily enzyme